jgi:(p)ppGpp synthase/HD superfamily hydrolase
MDLEQALELARRLHDGQTDQAGRPYMGHINRVVDSVSSPDEKLAAALHDLLEDTSITAEKLLAAGCPARVVAAVEALTRREGEDYRAFVSRAARNPLALAVKVADVADNSDEDRLALLDPSVAARLRKKYAGARQILSSAPPANQ